MIKFKSLFERNLTLKRIFEFSWIHKEVLNPPRKIVYSYENDKSNIDKYEKFIYEPPNIRRYRKKLLQDGYKEHRIKVDLLIII